MCRIIRTISVGCLFVLFSLVSSPFAATCAAKIDATLCQKMTSLTDSSLVSIEILLPEPPFSYPNKMEVSVDSARNYSLMVQDSLSRHLTAIEPQIDSLFVKYVLLSISTGRRISPPSISYDYFLAVKASVATINQLAQENLVARIDLFSAPGVPTTVPNLSILGTRFPFDTAFIDLVNPLVSFRFDTITVARYGLAFYFGRLGGPVGVFGYTPIRGDFWLSSSDYYSDIRFPQDTTFLLTGKHYDGQCNPPCTSYVSMDSSYKTHEYRFSLGDTLGHVLYMKVMDGSTLDSIQVRFDTVSFLTTTGIRAHPAVRNSGKVTLSFDKNFVTVHGLDNGTITMYDVSGKKLISSILSSTNSRIQLPAISKPGVFVVKVTSGREELVVKKCTVR